MNSPQAKVIGTGPRPVMALHGWFGSAEGWGPMTQSLDTQGFTYAFMDCRGYGSRRGSGGPFTMAQAGDDALALADQLGWDRFALMGHSMGGMAIQHVLAAQPRRVRAMVAIAPVPASGVPFDEAGWAFFSAAAKDPGIRRAIIDLTTGNRLTGAWLDRMVAASSANSDVDAVAAYLDSWAKTSIVDRVAGNAVPVLVIAGEHDPALGEETCRATWMQHYPNARLHVLSNAGHYPMEETPAALVSVAEAFVREAMDG